MLPDLIETVLIAQQGTYLERVEALRELAERKDYLVLPSLFEKETTDAKKFSVDWTDWLGPDGITSSTWTVPAGITNDGSWVNGKVTTIKLSGGTDGETYLITNHITTNNVTSETDDCEFKVRVKDR